MALQTPRIAPHFQAQITILTPEEGGRKTAPRNGIRWDFAYTEDKTSNGVYMIWPRFLDERGEEVPEDVPLTGTYDALMYIVSKEFVAYHKARLNIGSRFNCHEGRKVVARGIVTELLWPST